MKAKETRKHPINFMPEAAHDILSGASTCTIRPRGAKSYHEGEILRMYHHLRRPNCTLFAEATITETIEFDLPDGGRPVVDGVRMTQAEADRIASAEAGWEFDWHVMRELLEGCYGNGGCYRAIFWKLNPAEVTA